MSTGKYPHLTLPLVETGANLYSCEHVHHTDAQVHTRGRSQEVPHPAARRRKTQPGGDGRAASRLSADDRRMGEGEAAAAVLGRDRMGRSHRLADGVVRGVGPSEFAANPRCATLRPVATIRPRCVTVSAANRSRWTRSAVFATHPGAHLAGPMCAQQCVYGGLGTRSADQRLCA